MQLPFTKEQFFDLFAATLFLLQAAVFFWAGVVHGRLSFAPSRNAWAPVAWGLVAYSLVYPTINAAQHPSVSRVPTFGVPCPTTIFTAGMLMLAAPRSWRLSIVPVICLQSEDPRRFSWVCAPITASQSPALRWRSSRRRGAAAAWDLETRRVGLGR